MARLPRHHRIWLPIAALTLPRQRVLLAVAGAAALVNPIMPGLLTTPGDHLWAW